MIHLHVLDDQTGNMEWRGFSAYCPRVGEEIRLSESKFVQVKRVIWCFDEPELGHVRANIGVVNVS